MHRSRVGILTNNDHKFQAASQAFEGGSYRLEQIRDSRPEIQAPSSLEIAAYAAQSAVEELGFPVIREDHSVYFDGLEGLPGPYADYTEAHLGVNGLLSLLENRPRTGSFKTAAVLCDTFGNTTGSIADVNFTVAKEPRGDLQEGWSQIIVLEGENKTLAEYPAEERTGVWTANFQRFSDLMEWRSNRALYITGPHAAGKTEAASMLHDEFGYLYFDLGPAIRDVHASSGEPLSLKDWIAEQESKVGKDFSDDLLTTLVEQWRDRVAHDLGYAVIGSRSKNGLEYIHGRLSPSDSLHIHVDADGQLLHGRYCEREKRWLTEGEFAEKLDADKDMGLHELSEVADHRILNNGDKNTFLKRVADIIRKWSVTLPTDDLFYID